MTNEYAPFYAGYVNQLKGKSVQDELARQLATVPAFYVGFSEEQALYRYAPGKWSPKEILGHIIDSERIFTYRALRIARGDTTPLPGFEQDAYIAPGQFDQRSLVDLLDEFRAVRMATLSFVRTLNAQDMTSMGIASDSDISVRALLAIIAGHVLHHLKVMEDNYLIA